MSIKTGDKKRPSRSPFEDREDGLWRELLGEPSWLLGPPDNKTNSVTEVKREDIQSFSIELSVALMT